VLAARLGGCLTRIAEIEAAIDTPWPVLSELKALGATYAETLQRFADKGFSAVPSIQKSVQLIEAFCDLVEVDLQEYGRR